MANKIVRREFDKAAKEFFDRLPSADSDEADNGLKCLVILYLGLDGTDRDLYEAQMVIKIASRKIMERGLCTPT